MRTLGVILIHALSAVLAFAIAGTAVTADSPSKEELVPVVVTVKTLPDLGDPLEINLRRHEKLEEETRQTEQDEFEVHRAMWVDRKVLNYRFTISTRGAWSGTEPVTVTVRGGKAVSTEYVCPPAECKQAVVPAADARPYDTVPNIFEFIDGLLNSSMSLPRVHYDKQYGFPTHIANDRIRNSDDEFSVTVWDFQLLE